MLEGREYRERYGYVVAGLVAAWRDKAFAERIPIEFRSRFPRAPSNQLMPLAVEAAHAFVDRVCTRDAELRFIWDEEESMDAEVHRIADAVRAALGNYDERSREFWAVRRESTRAFNEWCDKGYEADAQGNKARAVVCYEKAIAEMVSEGSYVSLPAVRCNLMSDYAALGKLAAARKAYDELLRLGSQIEEYPQPAILWNCMAWYLYEHGNEADQSHALELVERSLEANPSGDAFDTKIRILLRMGKKKEAKSALSHALKLYPGHAALKDAQDHWERLSKKPG